MGQNEISKMKNEIIKYGNKLGDKNMSPATSGNISVRCGENILITASGTCLADLSEEDIVLIDKFDSYMEEFFAMMIVLQLLALEIAIRLGNDVDMPRNLAKSVTVE